MPNQASGWSYRNCGEARRAGAAPLRRGQPGYGAHMDGDGDGIACEPIRR
nr:excalibur calcium-binding domain-containing protein [Sphingomonas sp. ABOLH]